jgi:hypothetical protein
VKQFDGTNDVNTVCVEFPIKAPDNAVLAKDVSAVQQLEYVKTLQRDWSDNAVSVTVYYRREEVAEIRAWLREHYTNGIKSVSFLMHSDHGFVQAPLQEITAEEYDEITSRLRTMCDDDHDNSTSFDHFFERHEDELQLQSEMECRGGACPLR